MDLRLRGGGGLGDTLQLGTDAQGHDTVSTSLPLLCTHTHKYRGVIGYNLGGCNRETWRSVVRQHG